MNDVVLSVSDLVNSLLAVLMRFRKERVAITAGTQQMFYCFTVREDHRNFLRFLWYHNNEVGQELVEYRMGCTCLATAPVRDRILGEGTYLPCIVFTTNYDSSRLSRSREGWSLGR